MLHLIILVIARVRSGQLSASAHEKPGFWPNECIVKHPQMFSLFVEPLEIIVWRFGVSSQAQFFDTVVIWTELLV
jgi:hypothetical protein